MEFVKLVRFCDSGRNNEQNLMRTASVGARNFYTNIEDMFPKLFSPKSTKDEKKGRLQNIWSWRKSGCFCEYIFFCC